MKRLLLPALCCITALTSNAYAAGFADCRQHFARGEPPRLLTPHPAAQRELCFDGFAVLHSGQTKTPVFVAERLNRARVANAHEPRTDRFYEEARLPEAERAHLSDYRQTDASLQHYDRGHMSPAQDNAYSPETMAQSFSLANMVPLALENNRGLWNVTP